MLPLVSAIIPTYNRAVYITQAIDSALAQRYDNLEIIVVDDGSTDLTSNALAPYASRILLLRQKNQGVSVARNTAIAASHGEYIALLDSDDLWLPGKLARQVDYLVANPDVGMVACHAIAIDDDGLPLNVAPLFPFQGQGWVSLETNVLRSPLPVDTLVIRRECLPEPTPFTPGVAYGEDWEMCLRVGARYPIWFMDETLAAVRVHENNVMAPLATQQQVDLKLRDRLGVIDRVFPILPGDPDTLNLLRARVEAREYAEAAVPSYVNGALEKGAARLGKAVTLDPATWQGDGLVALISNFAKLVFRKDGENGLVEFLNNTFSHLPPQIQQPEYVKRSVWASTLIFTVGFDALAQGNSRKATRNIVQGLRQQPSFLRNVGVLSTLARSAGRSVRHT